MKPRAKWLNDQLMATKPGRHKDKKQRRLITEEEKAAKQYKYLKRQFHERDLESEY